MQMAEKHPLAFSILRQQHEPLFKKLFELISPGHKGVFCRHAAAIFSAIGGRYSLKNSLACHQNPPFLLPAN
jgi:hypothetical protein